MAVPFLASGAIFAATHHRHQEQLRVLESDYAYCRELLLTSQAEELRSLSLYPCFTSDDDFIPPRPPPAVWPCPSTSLSLPVCIGCDFGHQHPLVVRHTQAARSAVGDVNVCK